MPLYTIRVETERGVTEGERELVAEELEAAPAILEPRTELTGLESSRGVLRSTFRTEGATLPLAISTGISTFELALRLTGVAENADVVAAHAVRSDAGELVD